MYMHCCACYRWRRAATGLPSRSGHSGEHDGRWAESEPEGTLPVLPALPLPPLPHPCPPQPLLQQPQCEDTILHMGTCVYDGLMHYISRLSSCRPSLLCSQLFEHAGGKVYRTGIARYERSVKVCNITCEGNKLPTSLRKFMCDLHLDLH